MEHIKDKILNLLEPIVDWLYCIKRRIGDFYYDIKYAFQKLFRKHGCSDRDLYNLFYHLSKIILPKLKAFREADKMGHPTDFSEYRDGEQCWTKEEYDKLKESGDIVGGGEDGWHKTIDEMIFAFEFILSEESEKKEKEFFEKYNCDWHKEIPENLVTKESMGWENEDISLFDKPFYYDSKIHNEAAKRAQRGLELFGKYFMNLWD